MNVNDGWIAVLHSHMAASPTAWNAPSTIARNVSLAWYAATNAAPSSSSTPITRTIGLASITIFTAACAMAIDFSATTTAAIPPARGNSHPEFCPSQNPKACSLGIMSVAHCTMAVAGPISSAPSAAAGVVELRT
jgi:hypothetical protein